MYSIGALMSMNQYADSVDNNTDNEMQEALLALISTMLMDEN